MPRLRNRLPARPATATASAAQTQVPGLVATGVTAGAESATGTLMINLKPWVVRPAQERAGFRLPPKRRRRYGSLLIAGGGGISGSYEGWAAPGEELERRGEARAALADTADVIMRPCTYFSGTLTGRS